MSINRDGWMGTTTTLKIGLKEEKRSKARMGAGLRKSSRPVWSATTHYLSPTYHHTYDDDNNDDDTPIAQQGSSVCLWGMGGWVVFCMSCIYCTCTI